MVLCIRITGIELRQISFQRWAEYEVGDSRHGQWIPLNWLAGRIMPHREAMQQALQRRMSAFSPQHAVVPPGQDKHRNGCVALASTAVTPFTQLQAAAAQGAPTR